MTAMTGRDNPVVAFDCDGVLTKDGVTIIGQDNGQEWDVSPIFAMQDLGCTVCVMTCNTVQFVVDKLRAHGVDAYPDPDITDPRYKCPPDNGRVMVSNRKVLADLYVDDHGCQFNYGDPINNLTYRLGLAAPTYS